MLHRLRRVIALAALGTASIVSAAAQQSGNGATTPAITGRVIDSVTGAPIAGATVRLQPQRRVDTDGIVAADPQVLRTAADGTFKSAPSGGAVTILIGAPGYASTTFRSASGATAVNGRDVPAGGLTIPLDRLARIAGRVLDERGAPVPHAAVAVLRVVPQPTGRSLALAEAPSYTDRDGRYVVDDLPAGEYYVVVPIVARTTPLSVVALAGRARVAAAPPALLQSLEASHAPVMNGIGDRRGAYVVATTSGPAGWAMPAAPAHGAERRVYRSTFYPSAASIADAVALRAGPAAVIQGVDVRLSAASAGRVTGTVSMPDGSIAPVAVRLRRTDAALLSTLPDTEDAVTVADETGAFAFDDVPFGDYVAGIVVSPSPSPVPALTTNVQSWAEATVTVAAARVAMPPMTLAPPVSATVTVELPDSAARATAAARPSLVLRSVRTAMAGTTRSVPLTGGSVTTALGLPGAYDLQLAGNTADWYIRSITAAGRNVTTATFEVGGGPPTPVRVVLSSEPTQLTIVAHDGAGLPAADGVVMIVPADALAMTGPPLSTRATRVFRSSASGRIGVSGLPPGDYQVLAFVDAAAARAEGSILLPDRRTLARLAAQAPRVTLAEGVTATVDVTPRAVR